MAMQRLLWAAALFLMCDLCAFGNIACVSGTLADYIALGAAGCMDGTNTVHDFSFNTGAFGGGAIPIGADDIKVLIPPALSSGEPVGIEFASNDFSVTGAGFVNYQIGYTWDPSGDLRDILDPGLVNINTGLCVGSAFVGGVCPGGFTLENLNVFEFEPGPFQRVDTVFGSATEMTWGIQNNISLNADGTYACFYGIENDIEPAPEPVYAVPVLLGIATIFLFRLRVARTRKTG
jgi:hypothetical protein